MTRIIKRGELTKIITQDIIIGETIIIHDLGEAANVVTAKDSTGKSISIDWNDDSGSNTQVKIDSLVLYTNAQITVKV